MEGSDPLLSPLSSFTPWQTQSLTQTT